MADKPVRRIVAKPAADDVVDVRYVLPGAIATKTADGVEVRTCMGGKIAIPQSILATAEPSSTGKGEGKSSNHMVIEAQVRRDFRSLIGSLVAEVTRLTREVNRLEGQSGEGRA